MSNVDKVLKNKASKSRVALSKIKAVYRRGLAAWKQGIGQE